jgi:hypothetical protein
MIACYFVSQIFFHYYLHELFLLVLLKPTSLYKFASQYKLPLKYQYSKIRVKYRKFTKLGFGHAFKKLDKLS